MWARTAKVLRVGHEAPVRFLERIQLVADVLLYKWWDVGQFPTAPEILPASTPASHAWKRWILRFHFFAVPVANLRPKAVGPACGHRGYDPS